MLSIFLLVLHAVGTRTYAALGPAAAAGAGKLWTLPTVEQNWWARTVEFAPFVIDFAASVLLLLFAYAALGRRALHRPDASVPLAA